MLTVTNDFLSKMLLLNGFVQYTRFALRSNELNVFW